jgi:hypothetical protein
MARLVPFAETVGAWVILARIVASQEMMIFVMRMTFVLPDVMKKR